MLRDQKCLITSPECKPYLSMSGFRERVGTPTTCNQSPLCFGDVPNTLGYPPGEGPWGAPVRSPTSQAKMLGPPLCTDGSPAGFSQGTFSFPFFGRWLSFAVSEACRVKLSQAPNHSHHPSPKTLVSGVHPHTHCCRIKSWSLAGKLPAPCPASLHTHRRLREGPSQSGLGSNLNPQFRASSGDQPASFLSTSSRSAQPEPHTLPVIPYIPPLLPFFFFFFFNFH